VPKGETRSNWLQRPLTASQVHYAALDVAYLPDIYRLLADKLHAQDRFQWWHEDCQAATDRFCQYSPPELYYQKVKSAWKLDPPQLAVLQQVTCWRELQARERDVPRGRIVKDRACVDMARRLPQTLEQLAGMEDMQHRNVRKDGETLLQLVRAGTEVKEQEWPAALPRPLPTQSGSLVKTLKARVESCAAQLQIPQEMLARKKDYEVLVRDQVLPDTLSGWRKAVIGEQLLKMVQ
jgi:ribonuclease D